MTAWLTSGGKAKKQCRRPGSSAGQAAQAELLADDAKFIDLPNSPPHMAYEYPQINPSPENIIASPKSDIVKICFPLRHLTKLSEAEARRYWHTNHGPLIRSHGQSTGVLRYIQVHRAGHSADEALRASGGVNVEPYLGHAEVWISHNRVPTTESNTANQAALEDERKFIDFERSAMWVCKEYSFIDRR